MAPQTDQDRPCPSPTAYSPMQRAAGGAGGGCVCGGGGAGAEHVARSAPMPSAVWL